LTIGAKWLVDGAVTIATRLGVSQLVIGLTIVAIGTSLPEFVTSIVASVRGQRDIAVGNVVGSNLFNILCVLGLTSAVSPAGVAVSAQALSFDIPVMVAVAVICLPIFFLGSVIRRYEGALFLAYFVLYSLFLVITAAYPEQSSWYLRVELFVVLPLTVMTLAASVLHSLRDRRRQRFAGDA
jgi:cation:H+ antiporter